MADKAVSSYFSPFSSVFCLIGVCRRPIPKSNCDLVFTRLGRYFFFDQDQKSASWSPPSGILELLQKLPEDILQAFFDPDTDEDTLMNMLDNIPDDNESEPAEEVEDEQVEFEFEEEEETLEYEYDLDEEQTPSISAKAQVSPEEAAALHQARVTAYMNLIRSRNIDPFKPWTETSKELQNELDFQAITSAKERESLFAALCPELAERVRSERQQKLQEAQEAWTNLLASMVDVKKLPATWTEYSRHLKKSAPWYKLLDAKEMEVQYRAKLKELRELAITYNVRSNK